MKDFRSILISSVPGKIYHRKIRENVLQVLRQHRHPLHAGALPGEGIESICLAAKTFQLHFEALHLPWSLTFVDLQSAFYQVVREAAKAARYCSGVTETPASCCAECPLPAVEGPDGAMAVTAQDRLEVWRQNSIGTY